jgi:hypothetical protein
VHTRVVRILVGQYRKEVEVHGSNADDGQGVIVLVATRPFPRMGLVGKSRPRQRAVGDPR